jgi:hypothetical protein
VELDKHDKDEKRVKRTLKEMTDEAELFKKEMLNF